MSERRPSRVGGMTMGLLRPADPAVTGAADGLASMQRKRAMMTLSIAMGLAVLDSVIANVALPSIATELMTTPAKSVWIVNSYQVAMTVSLLPFASLGDIKGYRFVYVLGLVVFTVASLACGLAGTLPVLVAARIIQGIGAAGITSVNMALVRYIYPPAQLGRGMGLIGLVVAAAAAAGPTVAAGILAVAPWEYLFLFNVPLGILGLVLALRSLPATPAAGHRFDYISASLNAIGIGLIFIGADGLARGGNLATSGSELGTGILIFMIFLRRQLALTSPMLPVDLLRLPVFAMSAATSVCAYACQTLVFLSAPFYFQYVGGQSQTEIGLLMTPWPVALVVAAPLAGRLSDRYSAGLLCGIGLAVLTLGIVLLMRVPADANLDVVIWPMLMCGVGFGLFQSPNNRAFMASGPRERSGACAGMMTTSRLAGQTIGGLLTAMVFALVGLGQAGVEHGAIIAMGIGAAFIAAATGISFWRLFWQSPSGSADL